jgi:para-nitrobenzyl esterase
MSIGALLACPRAEGLFGRAIMQSGAGHHALRPPTAELVARELGRVLGVEPTREALGAVPLEQLTRAQVEVTQEAQVNPDPVRWGEVAANLMAFEPVVDGELLPAVPIERIAAGAAPGVEVMAGTTGEEHRLFLVPTGVADHVTDEALAFVAGAYGLDAARAVAVYRERAPEASPGELLADLMTDWFFRIPSVRVCEARVAGGGRAHAYEFAWRSPLFDGRLGSCHALELGFVFDTLGMPGSAWLAGDAPPQGLADEVHRAWVAFAQDGDPGWPAYDVERRATMRFDDGVSEVVHDPRPDERALWEGLR